MGETKSITMKKLYLLTFVLCTLLGTIALCSCSSDKDNEDGPVGPESQIAGTWEGTVYYEDEGPSDYDRVKIVLGSDGSYKDYNNSGQLVGSGSFTFNGKSVTIPSTCYIADEWGDTYTVTISGKSMVWTNKLMDDWDCEYRFEKK